MTDNLSFSIRKKRNVTIVDLNGKIIGSRASALKEELLRLKDAGISNVILNFQEVTSIDSLGVMAIVSVLECGLSISIIYLNSICKQIMGQNRAANVIPVFGTEEDAIGSFSRPVAISKELRRHQRITTNIPVEIFINSFKQRGVLLNISEGGALIGYLDHISTDLYILKHINITLDLPLLGALELEGKPVRFGRTSEMHTIGIELFSNEKSQRFVKQVYTENTQSPNHSTSSFD